MKAIETFAVFDENGKMQIEKTPVFKNEKVKILFLIEENEDKDFYQASLGGLANAYSDDEPDYDLSLVNEPNPNYARR